MHNQLIASELNQMGFQTAITSKGVIVSLNRPLSTSEVETALTQVFDMLADSFKVSRINRSEVLVEAN